MRKTAHLMFLSKPHITKKVILTAGVEFNTSMLLQSHLECGKSYYESVYHSK